ncbi:Acrylyl-CoA reductase AcuI [Corynebacterium atrinae]|uniref:MDR family oxidoreductase n=1 Tax=Corynebacterium atrinae TaxID=1336740 RepID=UPI0025B3C96F|nr:MDR family oxidoreductase [Corynebacterium atrinae]WJY64634.1 Acrylyl-CoA reductase AcuI [Corynebacterium atrinae]
MTSPHRCVVVEEHEGSTRARLVVGTEELLGEGDVLIDVTHSSLNYKDAMALAGDRGVVRTLPLIPGIDVVGVVVNSDSPRFHPGDRVVVNGAGLGEFRHGGYTTRLRIDAAAAIVLPESMSSHHAAAIGTAGFTAALSVHALQKFGIHPGENVLVTGATGGVGSIAVHMLANAGYRVTASTGRVAEFESHLRGLGAWEVIDRAELSSPGRPLQKARFDGVVDSLGSHTLVNALAMTRRNGVVTACGLAQGPDLPATVLPFILRAVNLIGINSVDADLSERIDRWSDLDQQIDRSVLDRLTTTVSLDELIEAGQDQLAGKRSGRTVVEIS